MVYVRPDGSVSDRRSIWRVIEDFIYGVIGAISLFVTAIFNPPQLEVSYTVLSVWSVTQDVKINNSHVLLFCYYRIRIEVTVVRIDNINQHRVVVDLMVATFVVSVLFKRVVAARPWVGDEAGNAISLLRERSGGRKSSWALLQPFTRL